MSAERIENRTVEEEEYPPRVRLLSDKWLPMPKGAERLFRSEVTWAIFLRYLVGRMTDRQVQRLASVAETRRYRLLMQELIDNGTTGPELLKMVKVLCPPRQCANPFCKKKFIPSMPSNADAVIYCGDKCRRLGAMIPDKKPRFGKKPVEK